MIILTIAGSIASIIGLAVSLYVLIELKKIKKHYLVRVRLPEQIRELEQLTNAISKNLMDYEINLNKINLDIKKLEPILTNILSKIPARLRKKTKNMIKSLEKSQKNLTKVKVREIYEESLVFICSLKEFNKDLPWS